MDLLIKSGRVIDPRSRTDEILDILVSDGRIAEIGSGLPQENRHVIDAGGCWVTPGLIDVHVHLRDPGYEYKETVLTGCKSAAAGGFTTICCMPNTMPVTDSAEVVEEIVKKQSYVNVIPVGAITKGQQGKELAEFAAMSEAGACGFSEDGKSVANAQLMKEAFLAAKAVNLPIFAHCEDLDLVNKGMINAGKKAVEMGLPGISNDSEYVTMARDILLAAEAETQLHLCHMSTETSVRLLREAKARGENVTGEAAPHHFALCDEDILSDDGNFKMNPPIRAKDDAAAILAGLQDDTIDVIATDHAPHSEAEKNCGFAKALNGVIGLETSVAVCITYLVEKGILTPSRLIEKMSVNPARILKLDKGSLVVGCVADITIIDPQKEWTVEPEKFFSKGRNTPFTGQKLKGAVEYTIVAGEIVFGKGEFLK